MYSSQQKLQPSFIHQNKSPMIIPPSHEKYNGRINIADHPENAEIFFKMKEKVAIENKTTNFQEALNGVWLNTPLSQAYFSKENIEIIQNAIRAGVYEKSGGRYVVDIPNPDTVKIIMRSIYLQYSKNRNENIRSQIEELNTHVLNYAIPVTYNNAVSYEKYVKDQSTLVVPLQRELPHDRIYKQLELKPWITPEF